MAGLLSKLATIGRRKDPPSSAEEGRLRDQKVRSYLSPRRRGGVGQGISIDQHHPDRSSKEASRLLLMSRSAPPRLRRGRFFGDSLALRSVLRVSCRALACFAIIFLGIRLYPHKPLSAQVPLSTAVWSADGELLRVTLASDDQYRLWTPLADMSPELIDAFLLKEDRWFRWHPGVNPIALSRAAFRTYTGGQRQGGSTLTMQLARRLYRLKTRTPSGELGQIVRAFWLEARYSKRQLLEAYLNLAPFGGNIEGVGAASRIYFGKGPDRVNLGEALTLAVIPQRPSDRAGKLVREDALLAARSELGTLWLTNRSGTTDGDRRQIDLPIVARSEFALPYRAPHFVNALLASRGQIAGRLDTTLDSGLQRVVERQIDRYLTQYGDRGIRNVSA